MKKTALALLAILSLLAAAKADEYTYRLPISVSGYNGSSTLTNFPVLVRLAEGSPTGFSYNDCETDGSDIRFADSNGYALSFEIDTWDTTGESLVWVKLPSMASGTGFEMRYGGSPTSANTPADVWSGFGGVWHMNENAASQTDRTGNGLTATMDSEVTFSLANGPVGTAVSKSGILRTADFFAADQDYTVPSTAYTVSGWYWWPDYTAKANANPLQKGTWGQNGWYLQHKTANTPVREKLIIVFKNTTTSAFTVPNCSTSWNHLSVVYDTDTFHVYVNGTEAFTYKYTANLPGSYPFIIGSTAGYADETRVMGSAASADWVVADYAAQTGTLLSYDTASVISEPVLTLAQSSAGYESASIAARVSTVGNGATSATVSFAYGTDPENLPAATTLASGLAAGQTATASLTGLADGTTYYYAFTAVNDASPAQSYTLTGSFTTLAFSAPTATATPCNLVRPSFVAVAIEDAGDGCSSCDVYFTSGEDPAALPAATLAASGVAPGSIVTNAVASPVSGLFSHYAVRVVNEQGLEWTATGSFMPDDAWTYDTSAKTITDQGGWVFPISSFTTLESGLRELTVGKVKTAGTNSVLDFRKMIVWETEETFTSAAFVAYVKDCMYGERTDVTELHLPDTVRTLGEYCFRGLKSITVIEPFVPDSVTSLNAPFGLCSSFRGNLVLGGGGLDLALSGGAGAINRDVITSITFGTGSMTVPYQFFYACGNCTNITFLGDSVRWHDQAFRAWGNYQALIRVPASSAWWTSYLATNTTFVAWDSVSAANQSTYWTKFDPDKAGNPPLGVVKLGANAALQYVTAYVNETSTRNLYVDGVPYQIGEVTPAYTSSSAPHADVAASVACEAPEYAGLNGVYYHCAGYVTETMGATGWANPITNRGVRAFTYATEVGEQRLTWLWEPVGYSVTGICSFVEGYEFGSVTHSQPQYPGHYAAGSTVLLTAVPSDASTAPFLRWYGDVPEGHETDNPLAITADAVKKVYPYFRHNWVYSGGKVTDGLWQFTAKASGTDVTLGTRQASANDSVVWAGGFLDLAKAFDDGYAFTAVCKDFCFGSHPLVCLAITELTLPNTMRSLGEYSFAGCSNLRNVTPFVPASVTSINSAFNSCSLLTNDLVIGTWKTNAVSVLGGLCFQKTTGVGTVTFGRGVKSLPHQMFYANNGLRFIYFMGDVPTAANALEACAAYGKCIFVPRGNASWDAWLEENLTPWTDLSETIQDKYWAAFPDGKKPLGCATFAKGSNMWFRRWTPHRVALTIMVR